MTDTFIGRSLGKYTVESKLGQGGMGMVYKGRQRSLNRAVAIKVLPALMAMDDDFVQRFRQEAQVIAGLQHENIVHVYDIDKTEAASGESIYFIVMEFVDGFNLRQRPDRDRPMPWQRVRAVGLPVARALDYAHRRGIVHRDIKPANVMETRDGKIKLMDFGIAKSAGGVKTVTGSVLGTPEYMAPEQAQSGQVTAQSDIYSLGVLLYELAAGRLPFEAGEPFAIALKHISQTPEPPSRHAQGIPPWLERVILKAMEKDPAERFADAAALAYALERAGTEPSSSPSSIQTERPGPAVLPSDLAPTLRTPSSGLHADGIDPGAPTLQTPASGLGGSQAVAETRPADWTPPLPPPPPRPLAVAGSDASRPASGPVTSSRRPVAWWPVAVVAGALALIAAAAVGYFVLGSGARAGGGEAAESAMAIPAAAADKALAAAEQALAAGELESARRRLDEYLVGHPQDPKALDLGRRLDHAERSRAQALAADDLLGEIEEAPSELQEAVAAAEPIGVADGGAPSDDRPNPEAADDAASATAGRSLPATGAVRPAAPRPAQPPAVPLRQLVQDARRHRANEDVHSLQQVLRQIQTADRPGRLDDELETWMRKVDGWVREREEQLREDAKDLLDDFADAVEEEDMEELAEVWDESIDAHSADFFRRFWETYRKSRAEVEIRSIEPWDREAAFTAVVRLYGRSERRGDLELVRTVTWHGRIRRDGGARMIAPFPG